MKRAIGLAALVLVIYAIYNDISKGTISLAEENKKEEDQAVEAAANAQEIAYFEKKVGGGDTVLSILEGQLKHSVPVSIEKVIKDFKHLNNGLDPQNILYGETYKFPDYQSLLKE